MARVPTDLIAIRMVGELRAAGVVLPNYAESSIREDGFLGAMRVLSVVLINHGLLTPEAAKRIAHEDGELAVQAGDRPESYETTPHVMLEVVNRLLEDPKVTVPDWTLAWYQSVLKRAAKTGLKGRDCEILAIIIRSSTREA